MRPRVWFGERWITSIFDLFEENVRYFPALLPVCEDEDPVEMLERGDIAALAELRLHNGTIYRWNRPIYDVVRGRPHLRVENRVLPAGPTVVDILANAAFYYGLVRVAGRGGAAAVVADVVLGGRGELPRGGARRHRRARLLARRGGGRRSAELVLRRLLPVAHEGLERRASTAARPRPPARASIERRCVTHAQRRLLAGRRLPPPLRERASTATRRCAG